MDPVTAIGLAASIIAVIQLTGALIKPATSSLGPSENDEKELKRLLNTMTGFQTAYNNLDQFLKSNTGAAETLATSIQNPIEDCKVVLIELKIRLANMTFVRKHIIGRKWDKGYKRLVKRLDDARQLFDVILQGDQTERLIKISQFMEARSEDIQTIREGLQDAGERLSEIHLTVQTNQERLETQATQNQAELRLMMEGYQGRVDSHLSRVEIHEKRRSKDKILRWLTITDPRSNHERACKSHKCGTGDWFTKGQSYQAWLTEPMSFFWLNGKAGCGKTVLSSTIIEETSTYCDENEGCAIAYFYFSFTDTAKQQCSNMLSSLLAQLAAQVDIAPDCLESLYRAYQGGTPPAEPLKMCLQTLVIEMPFSQVYIVVDAMDEIPTTEGREEACKLLQELSENPKAHVLMTSRREHDITESISECNNVEDISIQNPEVDHDIILYVREQLKEDKKLKRWSALHSEIEEVLSSKADGMFRHASCQLDTLKKCPSVKKVREALGNLPKTLDETYERILLNTDEEYRDIIVEALRWLCFSERVMTVEELAEAAVFSSKVEAPSDEAPLEISFNADEFFQDPLDILGLLSGLVVCLPANRSDFVAESTRYVARESRAEVEKRTSEIILGHLSIKEYLVSGRLRSKVEQFAIDEDCSHEILATNSIYFICFSNDILTPPGTTSIELSTNEHLFYNYCQYFWDDHAREVNHKSALTNLIMSVLEGDEYLREHFLQRLMEDNKTPRDIRPLYIATYLSLYWPCVILIKNGAEVNYQAGYFGTALQAASYIGRERIVQLLLDLGADINITEGIYGTALQAASYMGRERIIQLLLDYRADVNITGGVYGTALQAASYMGRERIVQLLLDYGADVNITDGTYRTALQAASYIGHERIVQLLLDFGADVNITDGMYGNALQAASVIQREGVIRLLLRYGANVNVQGGPFGSLLRATLRMPNENLVRLLFNHGAQLNPLPGYYDSGINNAISQDSPEIVVMLLQHGALMSKFLGGAEAEDSLAKGDFERFVAIQIERRKESSGEEEVEEWEWESSEEGGELGQE